MRGHPGYLRANLALFAAGFSTFSLLYCVQPLLPLFAQVGGDWPRFHAAVRDLARQPKAERQAQLRTLADTATARDDAVAPRPAG